MWECSAQRLVRSVVSRAGKFAACIATRQHARENLSWVQDVFFLAMGEELDRLGVPRAAAADMFNVSTRTYRRRLHAARATCEPASSVWNLLASRLAEPAFRDEILSWFPDAMQEAVLTLVHDMHRAGWLELKGSRYLFSAKDVSWSDEMVCQYVLLERAMNNEVIVSELAHLAGRDVEDCEQLIESTRDVGLGLIQTSSVPSRDLVTALVFDHIFDISERESRVQITHHVLRFGEDDAHRVERLVARLEQLSDQAASYIDDCRVERGVGRTHELRITLALDKRATKP